MRRFPAPWAIEKIPGGVVIKDAVGQQLAYVYGRETDTGARAKGLTLVEARHIASKIAELPDLLRSRE